MAQDQILNGDWLSKYMTEADAQARQGMYRRIQNGELGSTLGTFALDQNKTVTLPMTGIQPSTVKPAPQHPLPDHMREMAGSFGNRPSHFAKLAMRLGWYDDILPGDGFHLRGKLQIVAVTEPLGDGLGPAVFVIGNGKPMALRDSQPELFPSDGFVTKLKMLENPA